MQGTYTVYHHKMRAHLHFTPRMNHGVGASSMPCMLPVEAMSARRLHDGRTLRATPRSSLPAQQPKLQGVVRIVRVVRVVRVVLRRRATSSHL